jgi:hypothetical protein
MTKTIHGRLVEELVRRGCEVISYVTRRYTVLSHPHMEPRLYFVGRAGALRIGRSITDSRPVPPDFKARLLAGTASAIQGDAA